MTTDEHGASQPAQTGTRAAALEHLAAALDPADYAGAPPAARVPGQNLAQNRTYS